MQIGNLARETHILSGVLYFGAVDFGNYSQLCDVVRLATFINV